MIVHIAIKETCISGSFFSTILDCCESRKEAEKVCYLDKEDDEQYCINEDIPISRNHEVKENDKFELELWTDDCYSQWKVVSKEVKMINYHNDEYDEYFEELNKPTSLETNSKPNKEYDDYINSLSDEEITKEMEEDRADSIISSLEYQFRDE